MKLIDQHALAMNAIPAARRGRAAIRADVARGIKLVAVDANRGTVED